MATVTQRSPLATITGSTSSSTSSTSSGSNATLNSIINQLLPQVMSYNKAMFPERRAEVDTNQELRQDYSKAAAFADAQGLIQQQLQEALNASMGTINRASEGSGASQSSMRALLTQQAAQTAARDAAALGAQQAVSYGQIQNNFGNTLEALTRPETSVLNSLIDAISQRDATKAASRTVAASAPRQQTIVSQPVNQSVRAVANPANSMVYAPQIGHPGTWGQFYQSPAKAIVSGSR